MPFQFFHCHAEDTSPLTIPALGLELALRLPPEASGGTLTIIETCNAPGLGPHDATMLSLDRDVLGSNYVATMREIVEKQAESGLITEIARHGENFAILAYAASGNPRVLLKTIARAPRVAAQQVNEVIREYYRSDICSRVLGVMAGAEWGTPLRLKAQKGSKQ